jgi:hypothetical protein
METRDTVDPRLMECFLYWGNGSRGTNYIDRLISIHGMTKLEAQQLVVDEIRERRIELTAALQLWLAD